MNLWRGQVGVIGLDLGRRWIKACQLSRRGAGYCVHAASVFPRLEPGRPLSVAELDRVAMVLERQGFVGRNLALAAPDGWLSASQLDVPKGASGPARQRVICAEMVREHGLVPNTFECGFWELPRNAHGAKSTKIIALALPAENARPLLTHFGQVGLHVDAIEPGDVALHRACRDQLGSDERITAIVDFGEGAVRLVLMYQGCVVHQRSLPVWSMAVLRQALIADTGASESLAEAALRRYGLSGKGGVIATQVAGILIGMLPDLIDELSLSFSFVSHQYPQAELGPLLLVGGGAVMPDLDTRLATDMELDVRRANSERVASIPESLRKLVQQEPSLIAAMGLAMRQEGGA